MKMNLPRYSLDNPKVIWFFLAVLFIGGLVAFGHLGKKEDAPFVIKSASIVTRYPGATPEEVEQLITEPIEREIQSMRRVYKITSESFYGMSKIMIELLPSTPADEMPQMWDELRRKILTVQAVLPEGASPISVGDDYGDVFGIYYGLSADPGFTYEEMRDWAQRIKTELVPVDGVQKVTLFGEQQDVVNVRVSMAALASLFIAPDEIIRILGSQNALVGSSEKLAGDMQIRIIETGTYKSLDDIRNQLLTSSQGLQVRLGDIARVETGYAEPPSTLMRVNGQRAIGIGISTDPEKDVVRTGRLIERKLATITPMMPLGIALQTLYPENRIAAEANRAFVMNLLESVAIVILLIMAIMGFRAGLLIGSSLLFTIGGTLLIMQGLDVGLNRTSLAGFIIAMGMLVDNAIVVTDNAQNAMLRGVPRDRALIGGATVPQWGLFGATLIAVFSFLPLYLAPSAVAEIVKPLFVVLAISLTLSWVLALSQTPLFGSYILRDRSGAAPRDPYAGRFYRRFDRLLGALIRWRYAVAAVVLALFAGALYAMSAMPQNFFPNLDKPYFRADCFLPDGYNIRDMERQTARLDRWLRDQPSVRTVSVTMGSSPPRYYLASPSFGPKPNFANVLVELSSKDSTAAVVQQIYGGGSVRNGYRQALVGYDMATLEQQLTELDVTYLAEYNYWNLASNAALLEATVRYEQIVRTMYDVIRTRFEDGYVAKNDLLMIQTRLRSAEFYRIQVENLYRVALQNFNVLSGVEPDMPRRIADSITKPSPLPGPVDLDRALGEHPDYLIASRRIEYERYGVKLASARFMPRLSAGVQGVWNSLSPNFSGETEVDGLTFLRLSVPICHWGERRRAVAVSQAAFRSAQYAERQKVDDLTLAISSAWTNITEAAIQIEIAQANLDVAGENLSLNTFSYNEGQLAVLDVISSQISWIQAYTNVITAHFNEKVAISAYRKAANIRP